MGRSINRYLLPVIHLESCPCRVRAFSHMTGDLKLAPAFLIYPSMSALDTETGRPSTVSRVLGISWPSGPIKEKGLCRVRLTFLPLIEICWPASWASISRLAGYTLHTAPSRWHPTHESKPVMASVASHISTWEISSGASLLRKKRGGALTTSVTTSDFLNDIILERTQCKKEH